jgi:WD40 repeat protein
MMAITGQYGRLMSIVSLALLVPWQTRHMLMKLGNQAQSRFMVSGSADNTLRLWSVSTGKNLYTWEFPTAVKRVEFSDDDEQIVCITEQRMGHQCAIRVFNIDREGDGSNR